MFFFSSRRRHTICLSDWSSDVCSSDLLVSAALICVSSAALGRSIATSGGTGADGPIMTGAKAPRSEERRVGKGGRGGGAREQDNVSSKTERLGLHDDDQCDGGSQLIRC